MYSLRTVAAALLVGCASASALAQDQQALVQRIDAFKVVANETRARYLRYRDSVDRTLASDSVVIGPLRVLTNPTLRPFVQRVAQIAVDSLSPRFGRALELLRAHRYVIRRQSEDSASRWMRVGEVDSLNRFRQTVDVKIDERIVANSLVSFMVLAVAQATDVRLREWSSNDIPLDSVLPGSWPFHRLSAVSSPSIVARRCFEGDLAGCRLALELNPAQDPVTEWFDAPARRALVEKDPALAGRVNRGAKHRCIAGMDSACITVLRGFARTDIPSPLTRNDRRSFQQLALALGGPLAPERWALAQGGVESHIAAAAQMPVDSVVSQWQRRLRTSRTPSDDMSPEIAGVSAAWILILGALSLRSSRWR